MKKLLLSLVLLGTIGISGCACNQAIFDTNYKFETALVYENGEWVEYEIEKWLDYENDTICIWTKEGKMIYTSFNNVIMYGKGK